MTDYFNVTLWRGLAENVFAHCTVGSLVIIKGRLENNNYTNKEGQLVYGCQKAWEQEALPLLKEDSLPVTLHRWTDGLPAWDGGPACEVLLYEIQGGKHSWALDNMDSCTTILRFFRRWIRP